ncbi:MAG: SLC13 family permease [Muribaculaceae bacterium]|jgi:sodium-dependent dicarboxylate transporter 2/3/5|nr:SLC13/DASS family transporter [Muribaculaceae bacterium]MEE1337754.1 SLC13 family permease [Muribaculaceae bacterium]
MLKKFHGAHLMEALHRKKLRDLLSKEMLASRLVKIFIASLAMITLWAIPTAAFGVEGLTLVQQRVIAIFVFAILMWIFNAIPAWTTSTFVVVLLLFCTSDSSLWFFREGIPAEELGKLTSYKSLMACFADPIIMLFIGGFIIAIAATKTGLDVMLAKVMLKPFGTQSKYVLLGFITVTAVFSMFLSNTATAAMMLAFLAPVLKALPADGKGKIGLALSIPVAANVGGMGTPIGTPPNAIAMKYLNGAVEDGGMGLNIGFGEWMAFMIPFTLLLVFISWVLLLKLFPFKQKTIELKIEGEAKKDWRSIVVYITFGLTVLLWVLDKYTGVNSNVVAMLPVGVFCVIGVITRRDLEEISWGVLWMVAGGFALGVALNQTGLATALISAIPFGQWSPLLVIIGSGLICYAMANFISHTATANLLVPILAVVGGSIATALAPLGGVTALLIGVAIASSLGMVLPISTPPNAMAAATGLIEQKDMAKVGLIIGIVGLVLGYIMLYVLGSNGLIGG